MTPLKLWYSIRNHGDGSASLEWFSTEKEASEDSMEEGWGEPCYGPVDTYEGSDTHKDYLNDVKWRERRAAGGW